MNTTELHEKLNAAIAPLIGRRITNMGVLHQAVHERTKALLEPLGLEYNTWYVEPTVSPSAHFSPLFTLTEELKRDRRTAEKRGVILKLSFTQNVEGVSMAEMLKNSAIVSSWKSIAELDVSLTSYRETVKRLEEVRQKHLDSLIKALGKCECSFDGSPCYLPRGHVGFHHSTSTTWK